MTVLVLIGLPFLMPEHVQSSAHWVLGGLEVALLVAIVVVDPGRIGGGGHLIRGLSIVLTFLLVVAASLATAALVLDLVGGASEFDSPGPLLALRCRAPRIRWPSARPT